MGAARIMIVAVALIAAIGLAVVVRGMMVGKPVRAVPMGIAQASAEPSVPMIRVLVAKRDLDIGARISADDMTWQPMPKAGLNSNYITDGEAAAVAASVPSKAAAAGVQAVKDAIKGEPASMQTLIGAVVHDPISAGEPILAKKLLKGGEGGYMSAVLTPGMRAVAVSVSAENGAGGFILPGDHVDVIQVREQDNAAAGGKAISVSRVVVTNVRVLAIDQKTKPEKDIQAIVGAAATLEVKEDAAEALIEAGASGKLQLTLRSYADIGQDSGRVAMRAPPAAPSVKLYENGKVTDVMVNP
jgi:pilus assembly protein CpaB